MDADSPGKRRSMFYDDDGDTVMVTSDSYSSDSQAVTMVTGDDHFSSFDSSARCHFCKNGLQFRLRSTKEVFHKITYACLPDVCPGPVDWKMCCTSDSDLPGEHIICYQLTDSENSLLKVVEECCEEEANVVGLIIVNFEKSCYLSDKILKNGIPQAPPIYVVAVEDGEQIFDFISAQVSMGDAQVKVLVESVVDPESPGLSRQPSRAKGKVKTPGASPYNLYEELKKYLKKEKMLIGPDQTKFQIIFSAFQNYENQPFRESPDKAIKLLDNSKEEMFNKDFVFHLLVAYRLRIHFDKYNCDDAVNSYLRHCIEKFEGMSDVQEIAGVMHSFVERGDFTVQWYHHHNSACSVFLLLHHMAIFLLDKSIVYQEKVQGKSRVPVNNIYQRILWISVCIFFGLHAKIPAANLTPKWPTFLVSEKVLGKHQFSDEVVADFIKGFQFFNALKLPESVLFDSAMFAANLNPLVCKGLHLSHIQQLISAGITHLHWDIQFLCCFMPPLRSHYEKLFEKHKDRNFTWGGCSVDGTKLGVYKEAIILLEYVAGFISKQKEDSSEVGVEAVEVEITKFLEMLVNRVDLRAGNAVELLKALQHSKLISKKYRKLVAKTVNTRCMTELRQVQLPQICTLFKSLPIWKYPVIEEFLNHYPIPATVDLKDSPWSTIIGIIIEWFSEANCRKSIIGLIKRIGEAYVTNKQQDDFVKDLMSFTVPGLLQLSTDDNKVKNLFIEVIRTYIRKNGLQEVILEQVLSFLELVKPENHLQCTLLEALEKEIVPDSKTIEKVQSGALKQLITKSVESVINTVTSLSQLSVIDKFHWNFIASCCNHIQIGVKDLSKISDFYFAIERFSKIYKAYCDQRKNISQPMHELPEEIKYNPNNDVKDYFNWIIKMQKIYIHWQELFMENECNYDDIFTYASSLTTVTDLATLLGTTHLVYGADKIAQFKLRYSKLYEKLCLLLVKCNKDVEWHCTLMEMLNSYGVKFSHTILTMLDSYVVLPGVGSSVYASDVQQKVNQSCSEMELDPELILSLRKSVTWKILLNLLTELESFLGPIWDQLDFFVYFHLYNSEVFSKYLKYQMEMTSTSKIPVDVTAVNIFLPLTGHQESTKDIDEKVVQLAAALKKTEQFILSLIRGTATYEDIKGSLEELLPKLDIDSEFKIMSAFPGFQKISTENEEGKQGIKNMLELFQFSKQISLIPKICEQYHLSKCLNDPKLRDLEQIASSVKTTEDKAKITGQKASSHMKQIWKMLNFSDDSKAKRCLKIFPAVAKCPEFYQFIKGKLFTGDTASRSAFRSQIELITAQLQHEDYNERVLNHLLPAFQYLAPFLDTEQNLTDLMSKILKLFSDGVGFGRDPRRDFCQLETVNSNITLIQLWFSRTEGDTLENVSKELDCIMSTGYFELIVQPKRSTKVSQIIAGAAVEYKSEVLLHYQPVKELYHMKRMHKELSAESDSVDSNKSNTPPSTLRSLSCIPEVWNSEQTNEFVRKLGFLEAQKVEQQVKRFQQLNQTAQTLYRTMLKLRDLGHPGYLKKTDIIRCNDKLEDAKETVNDTDNKLKKWITTIRNLYKTYDKLMFFSVSKILSFHDILTSGDFSVNEMMQEIGVLFKNDSETAKKLKVAVQNSRDVIMDTEVTMSFSNEAPVEYVGKYLRHLCSDSSVTKYFLYSRSQPRTVIGGKELLPFQEIVRYAPNYNNGQLVRLLVEIYDGVPESYEVFHCSEDSTEEDLRLFLHRAYTFRRQTFTILEVNKLPYKLQEVILHHHSQEVQRLESAIHLNYIETTDSVLHEMPWVVVKEYKKNGPDVSWDRIKRTYGSLVNNKNSNFTLELVYGCAGDGKTHYIKKQLCDPCLIIAVNESFTVLNAISKLRTLPSDQRCSIFFNISIAPGPLANTATPEEKAKYDRLMNILAWFFFKLLVFGYVEDFKTGIAFRLPGGLNWKIFVEIPSHAQENVRSSVDWFYKKIPVFNMIGKEVLIDKSRPYDVDEGVQLVCKYLRAYDNRNNLKKGINKLYNDNIKKLVKFGDDPDLKVEECRQLLKRHMPPHVTKSKVLQQLFIKYMERRCKFLERFPGFNYNSGYGVPFDSETVKPDKLKRMIDTGMLRLLSNTSHYSNTGKLGEVLMKTMLDEVSELCKVEVQHNWTSQSRQQLIYEVTEGSGTIQLITLKRENLNQDEAMKFKVLGIEIPSVIQLLKRKTFDSYLSHALGVKLKDGRLQDIDESHYVLTLDYTVKMLNIHERRQCGIPVIIEGETGVGKTALINMLSKLWNHALTSEWRKVKGRIVEDLYKKSCEFEDNTLKSSLEKLNTHGWNFDKQSLSHNNSLTEEQLVPLLEHTPQDSDTQNFKCVNKDLLKLISTAPILELIEIDVETVASEGQPIIINAEDGSVVANLLNKLIKESTPKATAKMLCTLLNGNLISTFYKLNVHAALTPLKIQEFFTPIIKLAKQLKSNAKKLPVKTAQEPLITVFLDELNTSSCMGLFKEMIVDQSFEGQPLPSNIFLIAACNPHRGNSLAVHQNREDVESNKTPEDSETETWFRGSYYVHKLHPTLKFLMWNYGSLNDEQEADYIKAKMKMVNDDEIDNVQNIAFSELVVKCQGLIRQFAFEQLKKLGVGDSDASIRASSCVSQRDIQRVFTFYCWIIKTYEALMIPSTEDATPATMVTGDMPDAHIAEHPMIRDDLDRLEVNQRALLVALGLVYYMRLNTDYRARFIKELDKKIQSYSVKFSKAFSDEMNYYINKLSLPTGIAKTEALKENLFATIICTVTNTPLIIVGAPGSSKTLSFNLTISNLKGPESREALFRNTEVFKSLDPHYYQCSRRTTSTEIETVFQRAINRQQSHGGFSMPIRCVVFMDEAGLPEESHESLKVLHYHLDQQEVAFVGITNHVLDAAKTNRAVSLFRPTASHKDLKTLAKGCLCLTPNKPPPDLVHDIKTIVKFCSAYYQVMQDKRFENFFGLRDFIHFINYIRRNRQGSVNATIVLRSLERNFNGKEDFEYICSIFLDKIGASLNTRDSPKQRTIVEILCDSLADKPYNSQTKHRSLDDTQNEVRYKLIIDPSEDESITRLLFMFGILKFENTRTFMCSDFPGDSQLQKINTIAAIRHSAIEGHTVIMSQTDDIHESFYDLFNQHFRRIDDPEVGPRYFTNIAIGAHTKPSRVHENFQCIVVIKESEIKNTPAPFLNRFEKYYISHKNLLDLVLKTLPPWVKMIVDSACKKVDDFYTLLNGSAFYGSVNETVCSLLLSILPRPGHKYKEAPESSSVADAPTKLSNTALLLHTLLKCLHEMGGFSYMEDTTEELEHDANSIIKLLATTGSEFGGVASKLDNSDPHTILEWVTEALDILYLEEEAPNIKDFDSGNAYHVQILSASNGACMMIALITQWLVRFMCKKLMQLMTPEALILKRKSIPISHLEVYLNYQTHFSLNRLITNHIQMLDQCSGHKVATKLICYTRSSSLIHQLPTIYPRPTHSSTEELQKSKKCIETLIYDKAENLFLCKFSGVSSQTSFKLQLQSFKDSSQQTVFVLIINMKETEHQIINHIRIMIEEVDFSNGLSKKLFVLLLHFPPTMFYEPCYPALFLYGWDHYYLDTISQSKQLPVMDVTDQAKPTSLVDIRKWFRQSCLSTPETTPTTTPEDSMCTDLLVLLTKSESLQVVASRILLTIDFAQLSLEALPSIAAKYTYLKQLLVDKKVGGILCSKFRSYWKPLVIGNHLEQAASFAKSRESTLSISDSVDSAYKTSFFNFIAYMIYEISRSRGLELLFSSHCDDATLDLFLKLLDVYPVPKLSEIKAFNNTWDCRMHAISKPTYISQFPLFRDVSAYINNMIQQNIDKSNENVDILQESNTSNGTAGLLSKEQLLKKLYSSIHDEISEAVKDDIMVGEKHVIAVAVKEMQNDEEMWQKYYNEFVSQYLHMSAAPDSIEHKLLRLTFDDALSSYSEMKAIAIHCYMYLYQLDLAKVVALLKPLKQLKVVKDENSVYPDDPEQSIVFTSQAVQGTNISKFIVDSLFVALINILYHNGEKLDLLQEWYSSYRDLMSMSLLKHTTSTVLMDHVKAKYHIMETTFTILQLFDHVNDITEDCACVVAMNLCNKFFGNNFQLKSDISLNLENIINFIDVALASPQFDQIKKQQLHLHIIDGLFTQFFPECDDSSSIHGSEGFSYCKTDVEFFVKFANDKMPPVEDISPDNLKEKTHNCVSLSKFKFHLDKILCRGWSKGEDLLKPLNLYKTEVCILIGGTLLSKCKETIPSDYVPPYLQQTQEEKNPLMQQKLAHLYFYVVLERLQSCQQSPSQSMSLLKTIDKKLSKTDSNADKIILHIERQAVMEVVLQVIVNSFDIDDQVGMKNLLESAEDINNLVNYESHFRIMLMYLLKKHHGPRGVLTLLSKENHEYWDCFECLKSIKEQLEASPPPTSHLFPFIVGGLNAKPQFTVMYKRISGHLLQISCGSSADKIKKFVDYITSVLKSGGKSYDGVSCVRMMIWLCVYHEFYCKKKQNSELISLFKKIKSDVKFSDGHLDILRCFLDPANMINEAEIPNPLNPNTEVLELTKSGTIKRKAPTGRVDIEDPIWKFFNPEHEDPSDTDLRHALANMIAVVFTLPSRSNHIWYHLFCPAELEDSHLTGFMYPNTVKKGGLMYDCGCELNEDGQYGRKDYIPHATRGTLSLHSWYLMLWTNFGAFCVGLLTQPNAMKQIKGRILSDWMSIRFYCITQLRTVWLHMRTNMGFGDDERSFFIMRSMHTLFTLFQDGKCPFSQGKFTDMKSLDAYEKAWHTCVYESCKGNLQVELEKNFSDSVWVLPVLKNYRMLNQQYPHLATENEYMKSLVAAREAHGLDNTHLFALHLLTLEYDRLQLGGALLPDLVEFYQWIHTHLSHLVTYEKAQKITIGKIISLSAKRYSQELCEHLTGLFKRIIDKYNAYLKINGGTIGEASCDRAAKPTDAKCIDENTPLIALISHKNEEIVDYDWLYIVVMHIIGCHNSFLNCIFGHAKDPNCHYRKYLPDNPPESHPTEITSQSCIVPSDGGTGKQQFLKLIKSCSMYNGVQCSPLFDLEQLEQSVVAFYIAGKPLITLDDMRIIFRFRDSPNETTLGNNPGCAIDISSVAQELPNNFKEPLQDETKKSLEYHFHTATYQTLTEVVTGLRTILGHLIQDILQQESKVWDTILDISLSNYLKNSFNKDQEIVFGEIGIQSISDEQKVIFGEIEMKRLFRCMGLFVGWLQGGLYDFSTLPVSVFKHLDNEDKETLQKIPDKYLSVEKDLLTEFDDFEKTLNHAENHLITQAELRKSIKESLLELGLCEPTEKLITLIPKSILTYHYVQFRMTLRKIKLKVTMMVNLLPQNSSNAPTKWSEIIEDLWKYLPRFQNEEQLYDENCLKFDCIKLQFGDGEESESDDEPWPHDDDPTVEEESSDSQVPTPSTTNKNETEPTVPTPAVPNSAAPAPVNTPVASVLLSAKPSGKAEHMTTKELCEWLKTINVSDDYVKLFEESGINGGTLATLDDEDLKDMGISQRFIRKNIMVRFRQIQ